VPSSPSVRVAVTYTLRPSIRSIRVSMIFTLPSGVNCHHAGAGQ
jgi:hypothetical protein